MSPDGGKVTHSGKVLRQVLAPANQTAECRTLTTRASLDWLANVAVTKPATTGTDFALTAHRFEIGQRVMRVRERPK